MIKFSNLFLLILLISLNNIQAMEQQYSNEKATSEQPAQEFFKLLYNELIESTRKKDFAEVKKILDKLKESKIDARQVTVGGYSLFENIYNSYSRKPTNFKLMVIEYLLQKDFELDDIYFTYCDDKQGPLEIVIEDIFEYNKDSRNLLYRCINLLLGYGVNITEKTMQKAQKVLYNKELLEILNQHQSLINKAETNPTYELLIEAISQNKPYIIKIIALHNPELITQEIIELAEQKSSFLAQILKKSFSNSNN